LFLFAGTIQMGPSVRVYVCRRITIDDIRERMKMIERLQLLRCQYVSAFLY
jgi:hypothetical protein